MAIVFDEKFKGSNMVLGKDKLSVTQPAGFYNFARVTEGKKGGKWYWEFSYGSGARVATGLVSSETSSEYTDKVGYFSYDPKGGFPGGFETCFGVGNWVPGRLHWTDDISYRKSSYTDFLACEYGESFTESDILGIALDLDTHQMTCYINGVSQGIALAGLPDKTYYASIAIDSVFGGASSATMNLGRTPFKYPVPDGFKPYDDYSEIDPPTKNEESILRITMIDSSDHDYELTKDEIAAFVKWYNGYTSTDTHAYALSKKIGLHVSTEYVAFEKIISFEVMECK